MTAELVLPYGAPEKAWLAERCKGIGASEIAAVLGWSPWQSPYGLWWAKKEGWELVDSTQLEAGRRLEPVICDWSQDVIDPNGYLKFVPAGLYRSAERPWQLATPDRLIYNTCVECDGDGFVVDYGRASLPVPREIPCRGCHGTGRGELLGVFEAKHPFNFDGFGEQGTNQIPLYYYTQVQQQCDVLGVDEWFLGAYAGHELRIFRGDRDDADLVRLRAAGAAFQRSLDENRPPEVDSHPATIDALKLLHPSIEDRDVQVDVDFAEGYRRARALRTRAEALVDRYEARARQTLGSARRLMCGRQLVVSRSVYDKTGEDYHLHALDEGYPTVDRLNPGRAATYRRTA